MHTANKWLKVAGGVARPVEANAATRPAGYPARGISDLRGTWHLSREWHVAPMLRGYRSSGGVLDAVELETRSRSDGAGVGGAFADWLRDGTLFAFEWRGRAWIPRFQLSPAYLQRDSVVRICNELRPVFDNWDLSIWFSQRNDALGGHVPADRVSIDPSSVHQAARLERFLGAG